LHVQPSRTIAPGAGASHRLLTPTSVAFPVLAGALIVVGHVFSSRLEAPGFALTPIFVASAAVVLVGSAFAALHFAEGVAGWAGEPLGTLILTLSVTVLETSVMVSFMVSGDANPTLVRDTVYSIIMIGCNGLVGLTLLLGALRYREQDVQPKGAATYLSLLAAISVLSLVLPNFTTSTEGSTFSHAQLVFIIVVTLALYAAFLFVQTIRHRDYFLDQHEASVSHGPAARPTGRSALLPFALLVASLLAVVLLAETLAEDVEAGLERLGAPDALIGVIVAGLVLMPEMIHATEAALKDQLQRSLNVALGSSLAAISLAIPAVAASSLFLGHPLILGLTQEELVLLVLTLFISALSFGTGRTNVLSGAIHLVLFGTFVFLIFAP